MHIEPYARRHRLEGLLGDYTSRLSADGAKIDWLSRLSNAIEEGSIPAWVLMDGANPCGVLAWKLRHGRAQIMLLAAEGDEKTRAGRFSVLLQRSQEEAYSVGVCSVVYLPPPASPRAHAAAAKAIQENEFSTLRMLRLQIAEQGQVAEGPVPPGYRIEPWRSRYTTRVARLYLAIPRDSLESLVWPQYESLEAACDLIDSLTVPTPVVPPQVSYLALNGRGTVMGFSLTKILRDGSGRIGEVGVHPDHRRRGLARALVTRSMLAMAQHGVRPVMLMVLESNTPAVCLYRSLGFETRDAQEVYVWVPRGEKFAI